MSKQTLQEQFVEGLKKRGETQVKTLPAGKLVFSRKEGGFYYLGFAGSVRFGFTHAGSIPVSSKLKASLLGIEGTI